MIDKAALLAAAEAARQASYAPYSKFAVGAALLDANGTIHIGCNVENTAFGETCCAERVAIFNAVSRGITDFQAVAIVGGPQGFPATAPCTPCGSCRQVMAEFCKDDLLILSNGWETTLGALLPQAFRQKG